METLYRPVTLRAKRRSSLTMSAEEGEEDLPCPRLKLGSLVRDDGVPGWGSKAGDQASKVATPTAVMSGMGVPSAYLQ